MQSRQRKDRACSRTTATLSTSYLQTWDHCSFQPVSAATVVYTFYQGIGAPASYVGSLGDIYLDLSPKQEGLYGRLTSGWVQWTDPSDLFTNKLVRHTLYPSYVLWCSSTLRLMGWFSKDSVTSGAWIILLFLSPCHRQPESHLGGQILNRHLKYCVIPYRLAIFIALAQRVS